jgi:hypothetical protein
MEDHLNESAHRPSSWNKASVGLNPAGDPMIIITVTRTAGYSLGERPTSTAVRISAFLNVQIGLSAFY